MVIELLCGIGFLFFVSLGIAIVTDWILSYNDKEEWTVQDILDQEG